MLDMFCLKRAAEQEGGQPHCSPLLWSPFRDMEGATDPVPGAVSWADMRCESLHKGQGHLHHGMQTRGRGAVK